MHGAEIIVRSLTRPGVQDSFGNSWQYHPRSDRHSKIACWSMLFDLLLSCPVLQEQVTRRTVGFGINHEMRDFRTGRKKNLDLVICTPGGASRAEQVSFDNLIGDDVQLNREERRKLRRLPAMSRVTVGSVHLALEAKACMTAHVKALPRLYDELNSSHAERLGRRSPEVTRHVQPRNTERTIEKLKEIPRRVASNTDGFDALGIVVIRIANDGTPVTLVTGSPAPSESDPWHYDQMIRRMASLYASKFGNV